MRHVQFTLEESEELWLCLTTQSNISFCIMRTPASGSRIGIKYMARGTDTRAVGTQ